MANQLTPLGHGRVYRDPRNGELVVDADTIRRTSFAGEDDDFEGEDDFEGDDANLEDDEDDEDGEDDLSGDEDDELEGDEVGRHRRHRKKKKRRGSSPSRHHGRTRRPNRRTANAMRNHGESDWGMTAVSGTTTLTEAGAAAVQIRLQHDFRAKDITFDGSASGAKVTSIFFGDRSVWSNSAGIPVSVFGSSSFMRGLLKGQALRAGLDIAVNGSLTGAGDFAVTLIGSKPVENRC